MRCKVKRQRKKKSQEVISRLISNLASLNSNVEFYKGDGCIYSSCKNSNGLLGINLPGDCSRIKAEDFEFCSCMKVESKGMEIPIYSCG